MSKKSESIAYFYRAMGNLGISFPDIDALRRIEMTLRRWSERECNGDIERDEITGKTYYARELQIGSNVATRTKFPCADLETSAIKRLEAIMKRYPKLTAYHQGDPRGCALYIVPLKAIPGEHRNRLARNDWLNSNYTRGVAVCY